MIRDGAALEVTCDGILPSYERRSGRADRLRGCHSRGGRAKESAEGGSLASEELQAAMMSFADSWSSQISEATARLATQMATPQARYQADRFGYFAIAAA